MKWTDSPFRPVLHDLKMILLVAVAIIICVLAIVFLSFVTARVMGTGATYRPAEVSGNLLAYQPINRHNFNTPAYVYPFLEEQ